MNGKGEVVQIRTFAHVCTGKCRFSWVAAAFPGKV